MSSNIDINELNSLTKEYFRITDYHSSFRDMSFFSLRLALKAYSSTYQNMNRSLYFSKKKYKLDKYDYDLDHKKDYFISCAETIIHFQHFFELIIKDILRDEHELLASDASGNHIKLYQLLKGIASDDSIEKIKSIEFSDALERIISLIKEFNFGEGKYEFFVNNKVVLERLNFLRNRIWHRGTMVIRYDSLDKLVGKYIFPIVLEVNKLQRYKEEQSLWKYSKLYSSIDPVDIIIQESQKENYDITKLAFAKELMRAAYEKPSFTLTRSEIKRKKNSIIFGKEIQDRAELIANDAVKRNYLEKEVKFCPVCGVKSLVSFEDISSSSDYDDNLISAERYIYNVQCMCCSLNLYNDLKNPIEYGFEFDDYWKFEELDVSDFRKK